ncbi:DNA-binding response regulator [Anaerocolumna cellulosilytica]|uniref:Stage 0 sporulation protein A homolog n=1 Tax=Anaerocolumna cellulosilytica TaxID=433286 RepID=A0A6S6QSU3_9FIRM|nr:response regulator transcription factor [Anaerocolumna cellulosilytica]MBB5196892.1 DNA-binding response OmpR family regulator [Anaerocolumna cellulosilytica]BCJ92706.1 DNA-binding response regulator [Anaerocolumna cellulosilytica]
MANNPKRILIVEDEVKIVEFIESYLLNSGYEVFKAYNGREALKIYAEQIIDMVLLDLMLPDISGEQICKEIRKTSHVPIIMLTAKSSDDNVIQGLDLGADDYMTKPFSPRQMVARVNALFRRTTKEEPSNILSFCGEDLVISQSDYLVKKKGNAVSLTPSEYKLLITLAKRPGKVFTREELIDIAFDGDFLGYDRTIDSHIKNLRGKIEDNSKECNYILTIRGIGYKFGGI